jgi:5-keto 4-deoxyuronate isomerase
MEIRFQRSPHEAARMNGDELSASFLAPDLMLDDQLQLAYSHYDPNVNNMKM